MAGLLQIVGAVYLDEAEWPLKNCLDGIHLGVVQLREVGDTESLRQLTLDDHILHLMSQKFVIDISPNRCLIHSKGLQCCLHPIILNYTDYKRIFIAK